MLHTFCYSLNNGLKEYLISVVLMLCFSSWWSLEKWRVKSISRPARGVSRDRIAGDLRPRVYCITGIVRAGEVIRSCGVCDTIRDITHRCSCSCSCSCSCDHGAGADHLGGPCAPALLGPQVPSAAGGRPARQGRRPTGESWEVGGGGDFNINQGICQNYSCVYRNGI